MQTNNYSNDMVSTLVYIMSKRASVFCVCCLCCHYYADARSVGNPYLALLHRISNATNCFSVLS